MLKLRLKELRKEKGLQIAELAEKVNVNPTFIVAYEHGDILPDLSTANAISEVLGVTLDELIVKNKNTG
jgi:transcriptional regulator with XRE-family HTH domain